MTRLCSWLPALGLLALPLAAPAVLRAQAPAPAASLSFDEGSGTSAADATGNGDTAALEGGAAWGPGRVGAHALLLPGTPGSDAVIPRPVVDTTKSFTVTAWVRLGSTRGNQTFVSMDTAATSSFFLQKRADTGTFAFAQPYFTLGIQVFPQSDVTPVAGTWYHLAGVYDAAAKTATLYVNGVLQETTHDVVAGPATGPTAIGRGQFNARPADFANGAIDDVRFYQAALSPADVLRVAQAGDATLTGPAPVAPATLAVDAAHPGAAVSPTLYGLMTEEINHSYDGGLYGELIRNRVLKDDPQGPAFWTAVRPAQGTASVALDTTQPVPGTALTDSLRLTATGVGAGQRAGAANAGYWGIPVRPGTPYRLSFYAKSGDGLAGPLTADIESSDGATVYASAKIAGVTEGWAKYTATLKTGAVAPTEDTRFVISAAGSGTLWLTQVSLFPPTYNNRPNGNRPDLMQRIGALKPAFLRLPGGNYLEGNTLADRFEWKNTLGPIDQRPGHLGTWTYRSTDGLGFLEFLTWCEDLHMQPLLGVYDGYSLNGTHVSPGPALVPYVQDVLDEIEYVVGDTTTKWGAQRARDGHPKPFPLQYVEIGNEEGFDASGSYEGRFAQFYDAIRAKYPKLKLIAANGLTITNGNVSYAPAHVPVTSRPPDVIDDHFYETPRAMERDAHHYDSYPRTSPKIFVGEYGSQEGVPTPDLNAAVGDASLLADVERNADAVVLVSYAPQVVNVNPGASQWPTNLIGYDALTSYSSPSYYVQQMFSTFHGDVVVPATLTTSGGTRLYESVTRDSKKGTLYLKVVNAAEAPQLLHVTLSGVRSISPMGRAVTLTSASGTDTNTVTDPTRVVPTTVPVAGLGASFDYTFPAHSVTVLQVAGK